MKKHNLRWLKKYKARSTGERLQMLTCYDFQTAQMLNQTELDLILVGDSLGNVVLGHESTVSVSLEEMIIFSKAVKRGAKDKFVVADLPFGHTAYLEKALESGLKLFQISGAEAIKLEGAGPVQCEAISKLQDVGVPVMGHIGLMPQSVHVQGGYYVHGKKQQQSNILLEQALRLQAAGVFALVLECVHEPVAKEITDKLSIPTIGIGSGSVCDGDVLVVNDLLGMGRETPPSFVHPIADLYNQKFELIEKYLTQNRSGKTPKSSVHETSTRADH